MQHVTNNNLTNILNLKQIIPQRECRRRGLHVPYLHAAGALIVFYKQYVLIMCNRFRAHDGHLQSE